MNRKDSPPIVTAESIARKTRDGTVLLDGVSTNVFSGDRIALTGRSGSGKSLLLRAMAALDPAASGRISWHGRLIAGTELTKYRSRVVHLPQQASLIDGDVQQNLLLPFTLASHRGCEFKRSLALSALRTFDRDELFLSKQRDQLSGGERQIVAIVRALLMEPEALLLDEPTSALDEQTVTAAEALVRRWFEESPNDRAFVWCTHDTVQAQRIANRQLRLGAGRLSE